MADRKRKRGCCGRRRRGPAEHGVEFRVLDAKLLLEGCEDLLLVRGQGLLVSREGPVVVGVPRYEGTSNTGNRAA
jgi:hypothetical protein